MTPQKKIKKVLYILAAVFLGLPVIIFVNLGTIVKKVHLDCGLPCVGVGIIGFFIAVAIPFIVGLVLLVLAILKKTNEAPAIAQADAIPKQRKITPGVLIFIGMVIYLLRNFIHSILGGFLLIGIGFPAVQNFFFIGYGILSISGVLVVVGIILWIIDFFTRQRR